MLCVHGSSRMVSCHGKFPGCNREWYELQNEAKLDVLRGHLQYLGTIFGCSGRSLQVFEQCFRRTHQKLMCGGQFGCEF